ncbi:hypothetical protein [Planomicrobium sp. CPCC 101110]|uniref:hypothetical protein n=1 Tax=Planomicrobium sp. CPCC 101110 TaxID=2599619 RepID=UPI0011B62208|nr:hypothetical protein [Planomicrobium sp. CPCC 101110]TWT27045.1 hypothetical protein FQV30_00565 [Planomicrobium sp. CPCC 101110]
MIVGSMLFLAACGSYKGTVVGKTDSSFMLEAASANSEAEPLVHEIHLIDQTTFDRDISAFEELEIGDQVRVVPADLSEDFPYILALEVITE